MKAIAPPEWLLLFYLLLPFPAPRELFAQVLLCQIKAIHLARYSEQKLQEADDEETEAEAILDLWRSRWFDPENTTAVAYLGSFQDTPIVLYRDPISSDKGLTLIGQTLPNAAVKVEAIAILPLFLGLIRIGNSVYFETEITADENGDFQVLIPTSSTASKKTQYIIRAWLLNARQIVTELVC
jgi:hypothetical protein